MISLRRELSAIKCFGTDGEEALIDAFQHACPSSLYLICSVHVQRNTKAKLQEIGISDRFRNIILDDIFGKNVGSHYNEGLVDTTSSKAYDGVFKSLTKKWQALDLSNDALNKFVRWFQKYKSNVIKRSMLKPIREKAGLGIPPVSFTTNASESINAMLKKKVDYKRNELPVFLEKVKELIQEQDNEIEKAAISRWKYVVNPEFKKLVKTEQEWFIKTKEADRVRHLQRFATFKLPETSPLENPISSSMVSHCHGSYDSSAALSDSIYLSMELQSGSSQLHSNREPSCSYSQSYSTGELDSFALASDSDSSGDGTLPPPSKSVRRQLFPPTELSIKYTDLSEQVSVPEMVLKSIWNKAYQLLTTPNAIAAAPGLDLKSHTVMSCSGKRPHLVSSKKTGQYVCDKACGNWNSSAICSHTVAVAEVNGELSSFVSWFIKAKKKPSVTKLVVTGMPDGRGREARLLSTRRKHYQL